ncbi:hypothetical protein BGZ95_001791 [Linnemannia exigua]|uniref:Uncharacterized protein n=1 Tax=Linnemannia exigua TaxID=604196 RepID=A0AAD4DIY4_9FUNG|nr:hypothetical protein BGZ95_001791 [Linnemannia exigua]
MDRTKSRDQHGSISSSSQAPPPPPPKLIYGTSIDYQERAKRLRLMGPTPDYDQNPFNAPTVNAIENMFERVMAIARSSTSSSSAPLPTRRPPSQPYSTRPFSSSARTYERHQTKPEGKDTIAFTSARSGHGPSNRDSQSLSSSSTGYVTSTITSQEAHRLSQPIPSVWSTSLSGPTSSNVDEQSAGYRYMHPPAYASMVTLTRPGTTNRIIREEPQLQKQEPTYQSLPRAPTHTQTAVAPPYVPMKRPLSPEPAESEDMGIVSDDDVVEILSSDDEEEERELSDDEEHYSYSDEDELEESEEFEQYPDGEQVILDDDDDEVEDTHSMEPRWVDELDKVHQDEQEQYVQNIIQASQRTEGTLEDSQEEEEEEEEAEEEEEEDDVIDLEDDDEAVEEYDDGEPISRELQTGEYEDEERTGYNVSPEELRRQRNEMNRQLRGRMGMGMGMGMSSAPGNNQRHPLGPMEPLDLEDDDEEEHDDDVVERRAASEDDAEDVDGYEEGDEGDEVVIENGEVYSSDEEQIGSNEEVSEDDGERQAINDDRVDGGAFYNDELEIDSPLASTHQQPALLSHHLQENLRHLESVVTHQERYDSPTENVVLLLDSDEEEDEQDESPQDESQAKYDDSEQQELEYDGDSQDDEGEPEEQEFGEEYDQDNTTTLNAWDGAQGANRDEFHDTTRSYAAEADSVVLTVEGVITQEHHAHGVVESLQMLRETHEQSHAFISSNSSSELGAAGSVQGHISDNVRLNLEHVSTQETEQTDTDEGVVEESVGLGALQSLGSLQDEKMYSQPGSPTGEYEVEDRSRSMNSGEGLESHDTVDLVDSPRFGYARDSHVPVDVVMAETADYEQLSSTPEFETGMDANPNQEQLEEDLPSAGVVVDETGDYAELQQMSEADSGADTDTNQVQVEQQSTTIAITEVQSNGDVALIDEARARAAINALLRQQDSQTTVDITEELRHASAPTENPVVQHMSSRTALLDRLHSIAQEENIDLQSALAFTEPFSTPSFTPSSFMQPPTSDDSLTESTTSLSPGHDTANTELSDLSPMQPRRTRMTRMSTMAQTVRDGQAFMDQLASRSSPLSSKSNSGPTAESYNTDSSSSPSHKRGSSSSSHTRTAANMVLLVKEAREFCAGGPSRVGSGTTDEETLRDAATEGTGGGGGGGQSVAAQEDRMSTAGSQPSTPIKSGVVDLVAELVIQSKVKGHHALRINASPGRSPVVNASLSRSSSLEPSVASPMSVSGPLHPLSQPPPPPAPGSSSSAFTFGQGSPSKSALESPSVGFGFGTSFLTSSKDRKTSIGSTSSSSRMSPRKGSGLGLGTFGLDSEEAAVERELPEVTELEEVVSAVRDHQKQMEQDEEMKIVGDVAGADEIEDEDHDDEEDDSEDDGDADSIALISGTASSGQEKKKLRKATRKGKKHLTAKVQAKRLKRRELFWQKKQQALESSTLSSSSLQEAKKN